MACRVQTEDQPVCTFEFGITVAGTVAQAIP